MEEKTKSNDELNEHILNFMIRGEALIYPERLEEWREHVRQRAKGLFKGAELKEALAVMEALEGGLTIEDAVKEFDKQDHSVISYMTTIDTILHFSKKGPDFWLSAVHGEISPENIQAIAAKKQENMQFAQAERERTQKSGRIFDNK